MSATRWRRTSATSNPNPSPNPNPYPNPNPNQAHFGHVEVEQWWPAIVTKVWGSGEMDVRYDDGAL